MKRQKKILIVSLNVLILLLALACGGGGTPAAMSDVPIYTGATPIEAGDDFLVDLLVQSMEEAVAGESITMETKSYALPEDTSLDNIKSFYDTQLEGTDWKPSEELTDDTTEEFQTIGWQRGGMASEQLLIVGYLPDLLGDGAKLVIMLFSE